MQSEALHEAAAAALREGAELRLRVAEACADDVVRAARALEKALRAGGKVLLFGNGGSAADAQHVAAELVGRFARERAPLPAIALTTDTSALTAISNDYGFEQVFARQLLALGRAGDVAVAISTSGRSKNVIVAAEAARARGLTLVALTGGDGGELARLADICVNVPSTDTARVQECHLAVEHIVCEMVERLMFDGDGSEALSS
ncbi:MAG TPA: D-sedoheptulose 7-phosphate isomerase [Pyrinomonadaceae bacterium]|nr:D-sedoheptulose 7-phosphate isomerase [Pyrinomonadaceae bacterium]